MRDFTLSPAHIQVKDGFLHLFNPENHAQANLFSAVKTDDGKYTGFAVGGSAYFEAAIAFDPEFKKKHTETNGFPAFWSNPVEHYFIPVPHQYNYIEIVHMELNPEWYPGMTGYFHCLHKWAAQNGDGQKPGIRRSRLP